ncbi:hypothetical protein B0P06_005296 [Clostridium saccharoperbutylacetonicum]|uniref:DNA primase n=1 Tax=Clostridium saccharoperbutylacetonicum N1-4(HMT) TaxID=931276 RepID=M1MJD8_9CLOT|nr:CHC2 zinc finger domain-containing protein [Clostridium saccharoperbutylacetonicum]AGF56438.1 DNA primase [Clostridium saccharoperbutylacetonicum N1-4(HMT)]NRT62817.1 hypothetical protein [Clostridium saccharoperbutylacetonicum]NSB45525.1 hypothetical protein [Clostridium saccharoperbutylacetonicum]
MTELEDIDLREWIEKETGQKFNRENKICCPFHNEKTPSFGIKFYPDDNKWRYKCFGGCDAHGDVIDFIQKYKNLDYKKAREYLGVAVEKTPRELQFEKILKRIDWDVINTEFKQGYKLLGLFEFVNGHNEVIYYKAKFLKPDGKKAASYYRFEGDKIINKREGIEEVPYNLYNVLIGLADKVIIVVEGEKDANNINALLRGTNYVATSIKGCTNLDILKNGFKPRIYALGDTGVAGEKYKWHVHKEFFSIATEFKFVNLPGIKSLGDNKDVTDWLNSGHSKQDLLNAFKRSLDLKNENELQQDPIGVYKIIYDKKAKEDKRINLTDFMLLEADKVLNVDDDMEFIRLKLKSRNDGKIYEKVKESTVFNDLRTFRNMLGMDLSFDGNMNDLVKFKMWITQYFAIETKEVYTGTKFIMKNDKLTFICADGSISENKTDFSITADETNVFVVSKEKLKTDELLEIKNNIFKFTSTEKSISIIGTTINNLAVYQNISLNLNLHHLLMVGEAETGKSTILEKIIAPILNYPIKGDKNEKFSFTTAKQFSLPKSLSMGNYPLLCDEFAPTTWNPNKIADMVNPLKDAYDRAPMIRGDKNFKLKKFVSLRPIIIAGEENYPGQSKALITRSCIVYLSKYERTEKSTESTFWLINHQDLLNRLGRSLIEEVLNISVEQYDNMRKELMPKFTELNDRSLQTSLNIACGIEIFNILLERHGLNKITNYEKYIVNNIKEEVLDGGEEAKSIVEQMLLLYNDMVEDGRAMFTDYVIQERGDGLFIKTSEMLNQLRVHVKNTNTQINILSDKDFKKQATKAGYIKEKTAKQIRLKNGVTTPNGKNMIWYDQYNLEKVRKLKAFAICSSGELEQVEMPKEENKVIDNVFQGAK